MIRGTANAFISTLEPVQGGGGATVEVAMTPSVSLDQAVFETGSPVLPINTITPNPQSRPLETTGCILAAGNLTDITVPDGAQIFSGQYFSKTWRLVNTGTCTWTKDFAVSWFSGENFGAAPVQFLEKVTPPGKSIEITVDMTAPMIPGTYQGYWKLMDPEGRLFGIGPNGDAPFWIKIQVIQSETETPLPSPTVLPTAEALVSGKVDLKMGDVLDLDTGNIDPGNGDLSLELSQNGNLLLAPQNKTELYYFGPNPPQIWQCSLGVFNPAPLDLNTIMPGSNVCFHSSQNLPGYFMINTDRSAEGIIGINYVTWSRP